MPNKTCRKKLDYFATADGVSVQDRPGGVVHYVLMTVVSKQRTQQICDSVHLQHNHLLVWQVNDYQIRLRGMTRRMMATVSELSMYQAHSIKLSGDKEALEEVVMAASDKLEVWEDCFAYAQLGVLGCSSQTPATQLLA